MLIFKYFLIKNYNTCFWSNKKYEGENIIPFLKTIWIVSKNKRP